MGSLQDGNYHTYALLWNESNLEIFIDGNKFHSFDITGNSYFNDSFYLLFNLAVGGVFTGINDIDGITALTDGESASMYIDWVRVTR